MRRILLSMMFMASTLSFGVLGSKAAEISQPSGVVELFTSQGCYSCPPADKLIGDFSKTGDVLALSWHVNYWDYLGWKDIFASKSNTERQYRYAKSLEQRQVYTPQAIINGRAHVVGSNKSDITNTLSGFEASQRGMIVPVDATMTDESLKIAVASTSVSTDATLYMVFFNKEHEVNIKRGENGGKTLKYYNVVHDIQTLGMVKSDGLEMEYPVAEMKRRGFDGCALILQKNDAAGNPAAIIGATIISEL